MPKPAKGLWPEITDFENLFLAWHRARSGKRYSQEALLFAQCLEENLADIQGRLLHKAWQPKPWRQFTLHSPKLRLVQAPAFADRVVHHALVRVVEPLFERRFIHDSYACRAGRGTHAASRRLTAFLRGAAGKWGRGVYVLKADISKYFPHIKHDALLRILARTVGDRDALWLIRQIVTQNGYQDSGLPIGALTSQLFANAYLDVFDHFVKDELGVRFYLRYMDDFLILGPDKAYLWNILRQSGDFLANRLGLALNPKTAIFPVGQGIDFAGYRHWSGHNLPRKRNVKRMRRTLQSLARRYSRGLATLEDIRCRVVSFTGYMSHCQAHTTVSAMLRDITFTRHSEENPMADLIDLAQDCETREREAAIAAARARPRDPGPTWLDGQPRCRECDGIIPLARLKAVPETGLCVYCATELESLPY